MQRKLDFVNVKEILRLLIVTSVVLVIMHSQNVKSVIVSSTAQEDLSVKPVVVNASANQHMEDASAKNATNNILDFPTAQVVFANSLEIILSHSILENSL